jgi:hypothetical protein
MKTLLYVCLQTKAIVAVRTAIGTFHDFKMFKQSFHKKGIVLDEKTQIMGDSGFQGIFIQIPEYRIKQLRKKH